MPINYAHEGRLREMLADRGVRDEDMDVFMIEHRDGLFDEQNIDQHVETKKELRPHRFKSSEDDDLARKAWLNGNVTAAAQYHSRYGEAAAKVASGKFSNSLIPRGPGVDPEAGKGGEKDYSKNPWYGGGNNVDPKTGRYTAAAINRQMATARSLGVEKAADIASKVGSKLGDIRPARRVA